jgi:hypothetical protein
MKNSSDILAVFAVVLLAPACGSCRLRVRVQRAAPCTADCIFFDNATLEHNENKHKISLNELIGNSVSVHEFEAGSRSISAIAAAGARILPS